jgi:hypothetical protein
MSALFPKLNPFNAWQPDHRQPAGAFRLVRAGAAQTEAGAVALTSALLIHAGFSLAAYVVETIFLAAALAVNRELLLRRVHLSPAPGTLRFALDPSVGKVDLT